MSTDSEVRNLLFKTSVLLIVSQIEACFSPQNPNVKFTPLTHVWGPLAMPPNTERVTFIEGLKTFGGHGDPTTKEGLAVHMYAANASMTNQAFCNNDGELLIIPQQGRLDIQTELGRSVGVIRISTSTQFK